MSKKNFKIAENKEDLLVQVKGNHQTLQQECKETTQIETTPEEYSSIDKGHGRIDNRHVKVYKTNKWLSDLEWKKYLYTIIVVIRLRSKFITKTGKWKETKETSYYVCNTDKYTAKQFHDIILKHWGIENSNHYVRDVSLKEDASKIKKNVGIIARLRSFALNVLRINNENNIKNSIYRNSLTFERLVNYQNLF